MTGSENMIFKILDQAVNTTFSINVCVIKNRFPINEKYENLLEPWEMRFSLEIVDIGEVFVVINSFLYREIKKHDIYDICELNTSFDHEEIYREEVLTFKEEPLKFKKFFRNSGYMYRKLNPEFKDFQESAEEYSFTFKDIKFVDTFVEQMKNLIKDASYAKLDIKDYAAGRD